MKYPDLTDVSRVVIDCETHDPSLKTTGPGAVYRDGRSYICGVAVAYADRSFYIPLRHADDNVDYDHARAFLRSLDGKELVGANIAYDLEFLRAEGINFLRSTIRDVQIAESLIHDTTPSVSLEALSQKYLGRGKGSDQLQRDGAPFLRPKEKAIENMHRLPAAVVEPYARMDAELTLQVYEKQLPILERDDLMPAFDLESALTQYVIRCRFHGIRIDEEAAHALHAELTRESEQVQKALKILAGGKTVDIWSAASVAGAADSLSLKYPLTETKLPSIQGGWLDQQSIEFWKVLRTARQLDRAGQGFVKNLIDHIHNGQLFYQLIQSKNEQGGAISSRFSSRNPNMQNLPARNDGIAARIRSLFLPEPGEVWVSLDESQVEIRTAVHYAHKLALDGADTVRDAYIDDPDTDFHQWVAIEAGISRRVAKTIFFASMYGAGKSKIAETLGTDLQTAQNILTRYHAKLPFVRQLADQCATVAEGRGYIKTLLGRRRHFDLYGPRSYSAGDVPLHYGEAIKRYGGYVQRYFTYRAINALIQGSAADLHKLALLAVFKDGSLPLCILPIHDELCFSVQDLSDIPRLQDTMLESYTLDVPRVINVKKGASFGSLL